MSNRYFSKCQCCVKQGRGCGVEGELLFWGGKGRFTLELGPSGEPWGTPQVTPYHRPQYLGWHLHAVFLHVQDGIRDLDVNGFQHHFDVEGSPQPACHQQHGICQERFTDSEKGYGANVRTVTLGCVGLQTLGCVSIGYVSKNQMRATDVVSCSGNE